jgi:hypothetical protein
MMNSSGGRTPMTGEERVADFARAHLAHYFECHAYNDDLDSSEGRERILEPIEMAAVINDN